MNMKEEEPKNTYDFWKDVRSWEKKHGKTKYLCPAEMPKQLRGD